MQLEIKYGWNPDDLPRLYEIEKACFAPSFRWTKTDFVAALKKSDLWVAWDEDKIVGFIIGETNTKKESAYIVTLDVAPDSRGRGIGSSLIEIAEAYYYKNGIKQMRLEVYVDNPAQILYFKLGYRVYGVKKDFYSNGAMGVSMEKTLKRKLQ